MTLCLRRVGLGATVLALGLTATTQAPASAELRNGAAFAWGSVSYAGACTLATTVSEYDAVSFDDNSVPVTATGRLVGTVTAGTNPEDVTDVSFSTSLKVTASPISSTAASRVHATISMSSKADPRTGTTACNARASATAGADGGFTITQPMWAEIRIAGKGNVGWTKVHLQPDGDGPTMGAYVESGESSNSVRRLIPAGSYYLFITGSTHAYAAVAGQNTDHWTGTASFDLKPRGYAPPQTGSGGGYATLGSRSCSTGKITGTLKSRAAKTKKIRVVMNGVTQATFKRKKLRARTFTLPVASDKKASVTTYVYLRDGRRVSISRSYLACS